MPIDFGKPVITGNYATDILPPIVQAQIALAQMLDPAVAGTLTGTPTGAYRFNGAAVEKFNGTAWAAHVLNIGGSAAKLAGGAAGQIPYQSAASTTLFSAAGTAGQVLTSGGTGAPTWTAQSALSVGTAINATNATNATDLVGGAAGQVVYQDGVGTTAFSAVGTAGQVLTSAGAGAPAWVAQSALAAGSAVTATTQAIGENTANIATDAFVHANVRAPILSVTGTVAANALTVGLQPTVLDFRSATLTSGAPNRRTVGAALSLVVPSGASLGTVSAVPSRIVLLAIDNAGTVELAVTNISGGLSLDETGLVNTTAISAAATAANVVYSTSARTGAPYRVVGFVDSTQATAGAWATAPALVQGQGGQAAVAVAGVGQSAQNVTGSRVLGTTYYNATGREIYVHANVVSTAATNPQWTLNGFTFLGPPMTAPSQNAGFGIKVPAGASYVLTGSVTVNAWYEIR